MLQEIELEKVSSRHGFGRLTFLRLDLSSLDSVSEFAKEFNALDIPLNILVLNAGIMKSPGADFVGQNMTYGFDTTEDGFEAHIGVNHIAHSHLTHLLLDQLKASAPSRVVTVSSMAEMGAYEDGFRFDEWKIDNGIMPESYEDGKAYGQSKLANLMFTSELAKRMNGTGVTAYSCHPGIIKSDLGRYMDTQIEKSLLGQFFELAMFSAKDGALTQLHLATAPVEELENGKFYHPIGRVVNPSHSKAQNDELQQMLWDETEMAIKLRNDYRN
jgi:NAD(P)-dependent dehydrogenase (short-subunit alcohol dehydrogenase family)